MTMKTLRPHRAFFLALLACLALVSLPRGEGRAPGGEGPRLADLGWLAGHWKQEGQGVLVEELWMPARGRMMLGLNRTSRPKGKGQFEYLRIEQQGEEVVYLASPGGSEPTPFRLVKSGPDLARFENPAHDFPKVVEYRLGEDGRLAVSIAADEPGPSWTFERVGDVE